MITAMAVLAGTATPSAMKYLTTAKMIKAEGDIKIIGTAFAQMLGDLGASTLELPGGSEPVMLVSRGAVPDVSERGSSQWQGPVDGAAVLSMEDVLYSNAVGLPLGFEPERVAQYGWSGPYMQVPIGPDAWGNRYAINAGNLERGNGFSTFVISAGPDGVIDTPFSVVVPAVDSDDMIFIVQGPS